MINPYVQFRYREVQEGTSTYKSKLIGKLGKGKKLDKSKFKTKNIDPSQPSEYEFNETFKVLVVNKLD